MKEKAATVLVGSLQKFSVEDGPGIRTTVFVKGCPLNCKWCHNPEMIDPAQQLIQSRNNCIGCGACIEACPQGAISMSREEGIVINREKCNMCLSCASECYARALRPVAKEMTVDDIMAVAEQDKGFYDNTGGGITVSGGEVLMHAPFITELIDEAGRRGINVCIDTCGFGDGEALQTMASRENVTHILYDMKAMDDTVHKECTGVSNQIIIENLRMLAADPTIRDKIIMRMPLIRGLNDSDEIIQATGELYRELGLKRVDLLLYHNLGISKQKNVGGLQEEFSQPSDERVAEIETYFREEVGMQVEIMGRVDS